jgi:iron complex transport system substrate-binding protein
MTRRRLLLLLAAAAAGCGRKSAAASPAAARRVVSMAPSTTEALFAVGAGDRVVGRSAFCDWPEEALKLPIVGGFATADVEVMLDLAPDLVVGVPSPTSGRIEEMLDGRGVAAWFPRVDSLASLEDMIAGMGKRTAHAAAGARVAAAIQARVMDVRRAVAAAPAVRVMFVVGLAPVVVAGPGSFIDELMALANATNVVRAGGPWPKLGLEQVVELDPEVILDSSAAMGGPSQIGAGTPGWREVHAVREGRVVALRDVRVLRPGPRIPQGFAVLARALHPAAQVPEE